MRFSFGIVFMALSIVLSLFGSGEAVGKSTYNKKCVTTDDCAKTLHCNTASQLCK